MAWRKLRTNSSGPAAALAAVILVLLFDSSASAQNTHKDRGPISASDVRARAGDAQRSSRLQFEPNQGKTDAHGQFLSSGQGYSIFLTPSEATLSLHPPAGTDSRTALHMKLVGANPGSEPAGLDELPGKAHYFIGNDPQKWRTNVPTFARVQYRDVYPGIDLVYHGNEGRLEYDFVLAPRANADLIKFATNGARKRRIDRNGDLVLKLKDGELRFRKPAIYQHSASGQVPVDGGYVLLAGNEVGFRLGAYDSAKQLVIDPVVTFATYLGGDLDPAGQPAVTSGIGIATDLNGNTYITGATTAVNDGIFPVLHANQPNPPSTDLTCPELNAFVAKLDSTGNRIYVTYLGGNTCNLGQAIAADAQGNAVVTGWTESTNFPTTAGAFQSTKPNAGATLASFVTKFDANGALVYSSYIAAGNPGGVAIDGKGNAYLTGGTNATFSTKTTAGAYQTACATTDTYILELSPAGAPLYSSCLASNSGGGSIAVDPAGNIYVLGGTFAGTNLVIKSGSQLSVAGHTDAYLAKLFPGGSGPVDLQYSTLFGGSNDDNATGLAVNSAGQVWVSGNTGSSDLPVTAASNKSSCVPRFPGTCTAWVAKFDTTLSGAASLVFASYLGGSSADDNAQGVALDPNGNAFVAGYTASADFPTVNPIYPCQGCASGNESSFITEFSPAGKILFSTFLGGGTLGSDAASGIALDPLGNILLTGEDGSENLPPSAPIPACMNPVQAQSVGGLDAFVVKLSQAPNAQSTATTATSSANPTVFGQQVMFSATVSSAVCTAGTPTGTVTFVDGTTPLGSAPLTNGTATFPTSSLSVGAHGITASYGGSAGLAPSTSPVLTQMVTLAATATTLLVVPSTVGVGQNIAFTATVAVIPPGAGIPTGTVTFTEGATLLSTQPLSSGTASFDISTLSAGVHTITATYSGDANFSGSSTFSNVTVTTGVTITTQPVLQSVCAGQTVNFTAAASGTPTPTVQWQVSVNGGPFTNIPQATSTTLSFVASALQNGNQYQAVFTNAGGSATSNPATLTVGIPPVVTINPLSQTVTTGQTVTFTAAATGTPAVQWQVSAGGGPFTNIPGATSTTLTFTADNTQNGNQYLAVFTGGCGSGTSTAATLTVNVAIIVNELIKVTDTPSVVVPVPPVVTAQPGSQLVCAGQTVAFTAAASGTPAPTVQWQVSILGLPFVNIPQATSATLSFTATAVQNGNRYQAVFTNVAGLAVTAPASLTINPPPVVTLNPVSQTVNTGQSVTFLAAATGNPTPTVQWQVSTNGGASFTDVPQASSTTLSFASDNTLNQNQYRAVFTGACGMTVTTAAMLTVNVFILVDETIKVIDTPFVGNTGTGNNVLVQPVDTTTGTTPVTLNFNSVTQTGQTNLTTSTSGPPPPAGFQLGNPAVYYELTTAAVYTPPIQICIKYTGIAFQTPPGPRLFHFENGTWVDRTTSVDTTNMIVCGLTSSLSPFALFQPTAIADLAMRGFGFPGEVRVGGRLFYLFFLENRGPNLSTNVTFTDILPMGATFVGALSSKGNCLGPPQGAAGSVICNIGSLANREFASVAIEVQITTSARTTITDTGGVSSAIFDPNPGNNTSTVTTRIRRGSN